MTAALAPGVDTTLRDVDTPETPGWWMKRLFAELVEQRERMQPLWDRFEGDAPLPDLGSPGANQIRRRVWRTFQKKARTNWESLIVRSIAERLTPVGFRIVQDLADDITDGAPGDAAVAAAAQAAPQASSDARASRIFRRNDMPLLHPRITDWMLVMGHGYAIVGPPDPDEDPRLPIITAEDPRYVVTAHDPVRETKVIAALKVLYDDVLERDVAFLYLRDLKRKRVEVLRLERTGGGQGVSELGRRRLRFNPDQWRLVDRTDLPESLGTRIPVVRFGDGKGEFEDHTDLLDRINHMVLQRIVIATLQAFRQRAAKGVPTKDPKTGKAIDYSDIFTNDPGALWLLPATADLWESGQVDLTPLLTAVKDDIRDLVATLRMAMYQFQPDAANGSAEGASAMREGLVYRAEDRQVRLDAGYSTVMSLAFQYLADSARSDPLTIITLWKPIERFSLNERYDALSKAVGTVPWEEIMVGILQYEPDDIPRLKALRAEDLLYAAPTASDPSRGLPGTGRGGIGTGTTSATASRTDLSTTGGGGQQPAPDAAGRAAAASSGGNRAAA